MDDEDQDPTPPGEPAAPAPPAPAAPAAIAGPADTTLAPDLVRNSPEFRALQEQNRILARKAGAADTAIAAARQEAEQIRQAAEAERNAALAQRLQATLGDEGLAFWNQLSELSATDPEAAARALADWRTSGQTAAAPATPPAAMAPQGGQQRVEPQGTLPTGLHADAPLGANGPQESNEQTIAAFDQRIEEITKRNQDPMTRNRVTTKERDEGIMAVFAKGVIQKLSGARGR